MEIARDHPLVTAVAEGHRLASGTDAVVGGWGRLGNVGDGNILSAAGIPSVQYGRATSGPTRNGRRPTSA